MRRVLRPLAFLWASPNTMLGLYFVPLTILSGGQIRYRCGALEVHGGFTEYFLTRMLLIQAYALTLGHVILGQSPQLLDYTRDHEHVHIRQYERWGILFLPSYAISSFLVWRRGGNYYRENRFEKEAFAVSALDGPLPVG